jgi:hypothetical protein
LKAKAQQLLTILQSDPWQNPPPYEKLVGDLVALSHEELTILKDLSKVIDRLGEANGLLERCMKAMDISVPRALLWQNISKVKSFIADGIPK